MNLLIFTLANRPFPWVFAFMAPFFADIGMYLLSHGFEIHSIFLDLLHEQGLVYHPVWLPVLSVLYVYATNNITYHPGDIDTAYFQDRRWLFQ
jgi:hypothetical protein